MNSDMHINAYHTAHNFSDGIFLNNTLQILYPKRTSEHGITYSLLSLVMFLLPAQHILLPRTSLQFYPTNWLTPERFWTQQVKR